MNCNQDEYLDPSERYEWEVEIPDDLTKLTDGEISELLVGVLASGEELKVGHAFSENEVGTLRDWTDIGEDQVPTEELHRCLDLFVLRVAWKRMRLVDKQTSKRIADLNREIIKPLQRALKAIDQRDFQLEFVQDEMSFRPEHREELGSVLNKFLKAAKIHQAQLRESSKPGKSFDNELKYYHVHLTDVMLEFLGVKKSPSRISDDNKSWYFTVVGLLAGPVFGRDRERDGFTNLAREFVDNWNSNVKRALETGQL